MKDWLEFFGFWLADGCCRDHINTCGKRDYTISIKQNVKNEQYVLDLMHRIGFIATISRRSDGNNNYNIYSKQLWEYLYQFGRSADKYIPREFLELDSDLLKCLFQGYLNGDGSKCADGHYHLSSVSKSLMDNIQEIILKIYGITTQVRTTKRKHSYNNEFGICYSINVLFNRRTEFSKYGVPDKIPYNDNVYCLTLKKNHIMLVRHNGIIGWCGNCFREYVAVLMEHNKQFLVLGNINAITYKDIFKLVMENKIWLGYRQLNKDMYFNLPANIQKWLVENKKEGSAYKIIGNKVMGRLASACWYTNIDHSKRHKRIDTGYKYNESYAKYDNYNIINIDKIKEIPMDYYGIMGVPITYMAIHNSEQYDILGIANSARYIGQECITKINGKKIYNRILIKKKPAP